MTGRYDGCSESYSLFPLCQYLNRLLCLRYLYVLGIVSGPLRRETLMNSSRCLGRPNALLVGCGVPHRPSEKGRAVDNDLGARSVARGVGGQVAVSYTHLTLPTTPYV